MKLEKQKEECIRTYKDGVESETITNAIYAICDDEGNRLGECHAYNGGYNINMSSDLNVSDNVEKIKAMFNA